MTKHELKALVYKESAVCVWTSCYEGVESRLEGEHELTEQEREYLRQVVDEIGHALHDHIPGLSR